MRLRPSIPLILGAAALLAACDQSGTSILAGLGITATGNAPLVITPNQLTLTVGGTAQLSTNAPLNLQTQVQWSSLESTIVTISPSGSIDAVGPGTATITARYATDTTNVGSATVTVTGTTTP
ncbi:MAG TPA: Ig-like domain-containing protein [Gemmatimonadaceae bacterium]